MKPNSGPLQYFGSIKNGKTPASGKVAYWDGDVLWATPKDLGGLTGDSISCTKRQVTQRAVAECNLSVLPAGSVIISTRAPIGHIAINKMPMAFNQGCRGIIPGSQVDGQFLYYLLKSRAPALGAMANKTTFAELSHGELATMPVEFPPLDMQRRIVRFLDEKAVRVGALIGKKKELLCRLAEKRQVLINCAVTKGLNLGVSMKSSGIDWMGDIPTDWDLIPFKWHCQIKSGRVDPEQPEYSGMMLVAPNHIESGTGRLYQVTSAEEQGAISKKFFCPEGTVLYSKIGPYLRKAALYDGECLCSADMYVIDSGRHLLREYLFYFLLTDAFTSYAEAESHGVTMLRVNQEALGVFPIPVPSHYEQRNIVRFCENVDQAYHETADKVKESIVRLEEYRVAQITASVTGQLARL